MIIYKTKVFQRKFKKSGLSDANLVDACKDMEKGLVSADYGGHLYKQRIAREGQGKSGGYRTMIGAKLGDKYFFLYLFDKGSKGNIDDKEEVALKKLAELYLNKAQDWLDERLEDGQLILVEVEPEERE